MSSKIGRAGITYSQVAEERFFISFYTKAWHCLVTGAKQSYSIKSCVPVVLVCGSKLVFISIYSTCVVGLRYITIDILC